MRVDFSPEITKSRKKWHIFQVLKEKNCQPRILNPAKISFRHEEIIQAF